MFCRTVMRREIAPLLALIANERAAKSDAKARFAIWRSKTGFHLTNRTLWHAKCVADELDRGGWRALCLQWLYYARNAITVNREVANSRKLRAPCSTATLPDGASIHLFFMLSRAIWQLEALFRARSREIFHFARFGSVKTFSRRREEGLAEERGLFSFQFARATMTALSRAAVCDASST